jgi:hypothetical protein
MKIVRIEEPGFATAYVSGYSYMGYDHVSDITSSPVRGQAKLLTDDVAEQCAARARRSGRCAVTIEDVEAA